MLILQSNMEMKRHENQPVIKQERLKIFGV